MKPDEISREELFALVWEKPSTKVASELGISDVAVGKMCKRLQVPKPPGGYWAKVAAGKKPGRPPLQAYREQREQRLRKQFRPSPVVSLTKLQLEFFKLGLGALEDAGVDITACDFVQNGIRTISPMLAAEILIVLQSRYEKWIKDCTSAASMNGAISSLSNLVGKLLPHAQEQLLVFPRDSGARDRYTPTLLIRATADFLERVVHLNQLVRNNGLSYVVTDGAGLKHSWLINQSSTWSHSCAKIELCVSSREIWVIAEMECNYLDSRDRFETSRIPLQQIGPINLIPAKEEQLPRKMSRSRIKPYAERLKALSEAESICEALSEAVCDMDKVLPNERLALFDRVWFSQNEEGPLISAKRAYQRLEADVERWQDELERESISLCEDVLGIKAGDIVLAESGENIIRLLVEWMSVHTSAGRICFSIWGTRFRKDGLPGKRKDNVFIVIDEG